MNAPQAAAIPHGLSGEEVRVRRAQGQGNTLPPPTGRTYSRILRENVFTFINNVLFGLGLALVLVGRPVDALISVGIVTINVAVGVVQEVRAKRTLDRIALLTRPKATAIRAGQECIVPPEELVLGDVLKVRPGDQVLLDGAVLEGKMQVDESQLTGESDLIPKGPGDKVLSGSYCVNGGAFCVAEKVGQASFANQVTASARAYRRVLTPLQNHINFTIRVILFMVAYLELLIVANGLVKAIPLPEGVQQATVIAGLVPNGLFVAISVAYALAAVRIVRFGALVQQANAVESLSNVDVLCLDKTGTLTRNQLHVDAVHPLALDESALKSALAAMTASMKIQNKTSKAIADAFPDQSHAAITEVPFSSVRKWSAVAFDEAGLRGIYALGAPEMLRPYLARGGEEGASDWDAIWIQAHAWAGQGLRVLLVASHPDPVLLRDEGDASRLPDDMLPVGLVSLSDELRPEAKATLASFIRSGVAPKIISGDDPTTVTALARQAGLPIDARSISGAELDAMDKEQFAQAAVSGTIFGRIRPRQKEQLVDALQARGHYVAMIGDGVNDVLALKKADLGVAMQGGTQAARSVADIVLMGDSFAALAPAVAEGQRIVNGMQDILKLFLARIATMALVIFSALVIGVFPINLRHASLLTFLVVGAPAVMLAVWARPGRRHHVNLARRLTHFVVPAAFLSSLFGLIVFYGPMLYQLPGLDPEVSEGGQVLKTAIAAGQTSLTAFLVATGLLLVVFVEPPTRWWVGGDAYSGDRRPTILAACLGLVFVGIMVVPTLRGVFALQVLPAANIALVLAAAFVWLFLVRWVWRKKLLERFFGVGG
jgi:cation-transporting ATPase E